MLYSHVGSFDASAIADILQSMGLLIPGNGNALTGSTDALSYPGLQPINTGGVDATTLATPVAGAPANGGDDGKVLRVIDMGGHAHTITTAANKINGHLHIATFGGTKGSTCAFVAYGGIWYAIELNGVTLS